MISWPRGKYNGARIVGARITVVFDLTYWTWSMGSVKYGSAMCIGPFRVWLSAEYDFTIQHKKDA